MYGTPLAGEETKQAEGAFTPGHEVVMADVHVRRWLVLMCRTKVDRLMD